MPADPLNPGGLIPTPAESPAALSLISSLKLIPHIEGGYFVETDRSKDTIPNPFATESTEASDSTRTFSTLIYYLLTPHTPIGRFHRNKSRTIHLLHKGRATYVLIHPDGNVETFVVGQNVAAGENLQWIVEGGDYKASFVRPEDGECLISEVVIPGFEYTDHNFMASREELVSLVGEETAKEWEWLLRKD
ncbi:RmlC-like cupin domain-containing protein [Lipomyces tetrasporus]|uniref:RmlC-like cupin domain-containing protein n=1 Tax=Lipomyces tetrasporus TaxID=54092 RepID=A0AAD7QKH4_9ASCO|nr:RmlC-like cupin domain-containing protein [Lipomyces tetrasporus]KAJ8096734.1 RmlC-like cupin domain-containing protein [Lipomyces tetrasporus]